MTSPPCLQSPLKQKHQPSVPKRLDTNRKLEIPSIRLDTQIEKEESASRDFLDAKRSRSGTDPTTGLSAPRRSSDTPSSSGSYETEARNSHSLRRRGRPDPSRKVNHRNLGRNSLPNADTRISLPAAKKLTMMEKMSRKRVLSDGDFAREYWFLQVG
jgi:hypothetical protein